MKWLFVILGAVLATTIVWWQFFNNKLNQVPVQTPVQQAAQSDYEEYVVDESIDAPRVEVIAESLNIPWEILFLPDGELLVTERTGQVVLLKSGQRIEVPGVKHVGEGGLLGATLHPEFHVNNFVYLYQTTETDIGLKNQVVRYELINGSLRFDRIVFDDIPGARFHDGGRITFGPDGYLYVTVGDATRANEAQSRGSLEGTILRLTAEGAPAPGNPFSNAVYSYGHRNPQGLAWDEEDNLWSTEHGRSGLASGFDELNLIEPGGNYGWPDSEGDEVADGTIGPVRHSTARVTWAPGGLAYLDGKLFIPGLKGETLYEAVLDGTEVVEWKEHLQGDYGRLRTVVAGPDGFLYVTTSNRDGRADRVADSDDRILRINPDKLGG